MLYIPPGYRTWGSLFLVRQLVWHLVVKVCTPPCTGSTVHYRQQSLLRGISGRACVPHYIPFRVLPWSQPNLARRSGVPGDVRYLRTIGSIVNAGQIKKKKKNIAILQEATLLQDHQIRELARYADLTVARIRTHDTQIYRLQYKLLVVEDGIKEMIVVSNFQVYTSYHVSIAQTILARLQTGTVSIENKIDKIFEYLRIMSSHKATSAVIPSVALRKLLVKIENRMHSNPRLKLPYDPRAGGIWKYYSVIKIPPIVMDKMLVILMTIPVLDKSLS